MPYCPPFEKEIKVECNLVKQYDTFDATGEIRDVNII